MKILINLSVHTCNHQGPNFRVWLNKQLKTDVVGQLENLTLSVDVDNPQSINTLMIEHYGKNPIGLENGDIAVEILEIKFDELPLPRNMMYDQIFYPNWTWSEAPNFITDNCYLGYNGVWSLAFPKNVREWIMNYLEAEIFRCAPDNQAPTISTFDLDSFKKNFL